MSLFKVIGMSVAIQHEDGVPLVYGGFRLVSVHDVEYLFSALNRFQRNSRTQNLKIHTLNKELSIEDAINALWTSDTVGDWEYEVIGKTVGYANGNAQFWYDIMDFIENTEEMLCEDNEEEEEDSSF